jgi:uncharacterized membrane protein
VSAPHRSVLLAFSLALACAEDPRLLAPAAGGSAGTGNASTRGPGSGGATSRETKPTGGASSATAAGSTGLEDCLQREFPDSAKARGLRGLAALLAVAELRCGAGPADLERLAQRARP